MNEVATTPHEDVFCDGIVKMLEEKYLNLVGRYYRQYDTLIGRNAVLDAIARAAANIPYERSKYTDTTAYTKRLKDMIDTLEREYLV